MEAKPKSKAAQSRLSSQKRLSDSQVVALGKIVECTKFTPNKETGLLSASRKSLVNKGFATVDASGTKIKITAAGRKAYNKSISSPVAG